MSEFCQNHIKLLQWDISTIGLMKSKQVFIISKRITLLNLMHDLHCEVMSYLKDNDKSPQWLVFAKQTSHGFVMLDNKDLQWQALEKIAHQVGLKHPSFHKGTVVDYLSILVNTKVTDVAKDHQLKPIKKLLVIEKKYLQSQLIEVVHQNTHIPWHHWMIKICDLKNGFLVKDLTSGNNIEVIKKDCGDNRIYYLLPQLI